MIGLDTNILLRIVLNDDPPQVRRATRLLETLDERNYGFVNIISMVELVWTLRRTFRFGRGDVIATIQTLLNSRDIIIEDEAIVAEAVDRMQNSKADFADCLIVARNHALGCTRTVTFDRKAAAAIPGMEALA